MNILNKNFEKREKKWKKKFPGDMKKLEEDLTMSKFLKKMKKRGRRKRKRDAERFYEYLRNLSAEELRQWSKNLMELYKEKEKDIRKLRELCQDKEIE